MKSLSVLFPELTEGQWAMLLRLLMEAAPEKEIIHGGEIRDHEAAGYNLAIEAYKRNITLLLEGE